MLRFERLPEPLDPFKEYLVLTQEEYSSNFHLVMLSGDQQKFLGEFSISHFQYKHDILTALRIAVTDILNKANPQINLKPSSWFVIYFEGHHNLLWCSKEFESKMKRLSMFNLTNNGLAFMLEGTKFE